MHFYGPLVKQAAHLTMRSAFVRSGALWSPFPLVTSVVVLVFILVLAGLLVRKTGAGVIALSRSRQLLNATFWALIAAIGSAAGALLITFLFELVVYAPSELLSATIQTAMAKQRGLDIVEYQQTIEQFQQELADARNAFKPLDLSATNGRLEVGYVNVVKATLASGKGFCVDIYLVNRGATEVQGAAHFGFPFATFFDGSSDSVDASFTSLRYFPQPPDQYFRDELSPSDHSKFFRECIPMKSYKEAVHKHYVLVFPSITYWRDKTMGEDQTGVMESCGYYAGADDFTIFHDCAGHNRSYLLNRPKIEATANH